VSAQTKRQIEACVDEKKNGKKFGRVAQRSLKCQHVQAEYAQFLYQEYEHNVSH